MGRGKGEASCSQEMDNQAWNVTSEGNAPSHRQGACVQGNCAIYFKDNIEHGSGSLPCCVLWPIYLRGAKFEAAISCLFMLQRKT